MSLLSTLPDCDFNSIKVQLKLVGAEDAVTVTSFQFHKGTIKTSIAETTAVACSYFNSIKVQLKPILTQTKMSLYTIGFRVQRYKKYF